MRSRDTWKPRHSLDEAIELLSPEIRNVLRERLNGEFREIRRYQPSRSLELESGGGTIESEIEQSEALPDDEEGERDD